METSRIAILISGRGSNMQAFIDASATGAINASICTVVSNNPEAGGLKSAADAGIPTACVNHRDFNSREDFDQALVDCLDQYQPRSRHFSRVYAHPHTRVHRTLFRPIIEHSSVFAAKISRAQYSPESTGCRRQGSWRHRSLCDG